MTKRIFISVLTLLAWIATAWGQPSLRNTLTIPDVTMPSGKGIALPVNLDNTTDIVALQFTLTLPDGLALQDDSVRLTSRADGHTLLVQKASGNSGKYLFLVMSAANKPFKQRTGALITIPLTCNTSMANGDTLQLGMSDVVLSARDGSNLVTGYSAGKVTISQLADLTVRQVTTTATTFLPGDTITASWQVANLGDAATTGGWAEQVFLDGGNGLSKRVATLNSQQSLTTGGAVSRQATLVIPTALGFSGEARLRVRVVPDNADDEPSWLRNNNEAMAEGSLTVGRRLTLSPATGHIDEASGRKLSLKVTRSGSTAEQEAFSISAKADGRVTAPSQVTFPAGNTSANVDVSITPNGTLDDDSTCVVTISGNGYTEAQGHFILVDDVLPQLYLSTYQQEVTEGQTLTIVIAAQRTLDHNLPVTLVCDLPARFNIPSPITIPAGEDTVAVRVTAINDNTPDVEQVVAFSASAVGHAPARLLTTLVDDDVPTLHLELSPRSISEGAGPLSVTARLWRTDNVDKDITVRLSDDAGGGLYYARQTVTMAAGVEEVTVNLGPVDNALVDGERTWHITAAVFIPSCSCNASVGTSGGVVTDSITVYDDDGPTLSMQGPSVLKEGDEMTVTLSRNTHAGALTVALANDKAGRLQLPPTVTFADGSTETTFTVKSLGNTTTGDGFTTSVTATADGYATASLWFTVSDQTLADATISAFTLSAHEAEAGGTLTATLTVDNQGSLALPAQNKVGIYLSGQAEPLLTALLPEALAPGQQMTLTRIITLPDGIGTYSIYAVANDGHDVRELNYTNNTSSPVTVTTKAPFALTVQVNKAICTVGDSVIISGKATGSNAANHRVEVYVMNSGYRQTLAVTTADDGSFTATYRPYSGQVGHFAVGACYPGENSRTEMAAFDIYGLSQSGSPVTCQVTPGDNYQGTISLSNPGTLPLTGLTVKAGTLPQGCQLTFNAPTTLSGGQTVAVGFTLTADRLTEGNDWQRIPVSITTHEGATLETTLYYYCRAKRGKLSASTVSINTTMTKGAQRDYPFTLTNVGQGATGTITLSLPAWMTAVTPLEMPSLDKDGQAQVILRLTPTSDMQLNVPVYGTIGINCANGEGLSIPYNIEPVSDQTGTLSIDVCDEYTYYTAEAPRVAGATVTVAHPTTGATIASGITDANGRYQVSLPEGYYAVTVSADKHDSYRNNLLVDAGRDNLTTVNLSVSAVTVNWNVEETEVEDKYDVTTTVTYETQVPVPVVETIIPKRIDMESLDRGQSLIFNAVMTNKGLIAAHDVQLVLPSGLKTMTFECMDHKDPFTLAPGQSVMIPVRVTVKADSTGMAKKARAKAQDDLKRPIDDDPCAGQVGTLYFWDCGLDRKWHRYDVALQWGSCNSNDPSTWDVTPTPAGPEGWTGGWPVGTSVGQGTGNLPSPGNGSSDYYGSFGMKPIANGKTEECEPCQNTFLVTLADCGASFSGVYVAGKEAIKKIAEGIEKYKDFTKNKDIFQNIDYKKVALTAVKVVASHIIKERINNYISDLKKDPEWSDAIEEAEDIYDEFGDICKHASEAFAKRDTTKGIRTLFELKDKINGDEEMTLTKKFDILTKLFCFTKLFKDCDLAGDSVSPGQQKTVKKYPDYIQEFQKDAILPFSDEMALQSIDAEFYGDLAWLAADDDQLGSFMDEFEALQDSDGLLSTAAIDSLAKVRPENISLEKYNKFVDRWNNTITGKESDNRINGEKTLKYMMLTQAIDSIVLARGYNGIDDLYETAYNKCVAAANEHKGSVCSSITLQLSQQMVMTRQAFRGTLQVYNGSETTAMSDVRLTLVVTDDNGHIATSHEFQMSPEKLDQFTGDLTMDGTWQLGSLGAQQTGTATILFIPTRYAAPETSRPYSFGGSLSYVDPYTGLTVTRQLQPVKLTVKPSPVLDMTYFMQRDVLGDDPLTVAVEPSQDAEFALLVNNTGYGDATQVRLTTQQPRIVDNEKGLAVKFTLVSSSLNGQRQALALDSTAVSDFGTIAAHHTAYAQWWLRSSLLGHFTTYNVAATHVTSYGNSDLSLLGDVSIHELIRSIDVPRGDSMLTAFLVNDIDDAADAPDRLYLVNGDTLDVAPAGATISRVSATEYRLTLTPSAAAGWSYGFVADPTYGTATVQKVTRQRDGRELPQRNLWQTDRTLRDGLDPLYENHIHLVDSLVAGQPETYVLTVTPAPEQLLDIVAFENVPATDSLALKPVDTVRVVFNKPVNPQTFTTADLSLTVQGKAIDTTPIGITSQDNKTFIIDLSAINPSADNGYYVLTVRTDSINDAEGFAGKNGHTASWVMYRDGMVRLITAASPAQSGNITFTDDATPKAATRRQAPTVNDVDSSRAHYGATIRLKATPVKGYHFVSWTAEGKVVSTDSVLSQVALGDMNYVANFAKDKVALTIATSDSGTIGGTATGLYDYGTTVRLTPQPDDDYAFEAWTINGKPAGTADTLNVTLTQPLTVAARFKRVFFTQRLVLRQGWNWVSTALAETVSTNVFGDYVTETIGQQGATTTLLPGTAVKARATGAFAINLRGRLLNLSTTPISLSAGWNWVACPSLAPLDISQAIANPRTGDCIASQTGFATYADGAWQGSISTLQPGQGYLYKTLEARQLDVDLSAVTTATDAEPTGIDFRSYPQTMNIVASLLRDDLRQESGQYDVLAQTNNEPRGKATVVGNHYYLTVYGDADSTLTFTVTETATGQTFTALEQPHFTADVWGSPSSPYELHIQGAPTSVTVTIGPDEWASFASPYALDFRQVAGLTPYVVTAASGNTAIVNAVKEAPPRTGLLLNGAQGTYTIPVTTEAETPAINLLEPAITAIALHKGDGYAFGSLGGKVGFVAVGNKGITIDAGHAWLPAMGAQARAFIPLDEGSLTGIAGNETLVDDDNLQRYNLAGQRVSKNYRGVVIVKGKKTVEKH